MTRDIEAIPFRQVYLRSIYILVTTYILTMIYDEPYNRPRFMHRRVTTLSRNTFLPRFLRYGSMNAFYLGRMVRRSNKRNMFLVTQRKMNSVVRKLSLSFIYARYTRYAADACTYTLFKRLSESCLSMQNDTFNTHRTQTQCTSYRA